MVSILISLPDFLSFKYNGDFAFFEMSLKCYDLGD